jgi:hypothetical protein
LINADSHARTPDRYAPRPMQQHLSPPNNVIHEQYFLSALYIEINQHCFNVYLNTGSVPNRLKKTIMKKPILLIALCLFCVSTFSQDFEWASKFGNKFNDNGMAMAIDDSGNIYNAGHFQDTVDFDPGSGTFNMVATGIYHPYLSKLDAAGNFLWAKKLVDSALVTRVNCINLDDSGNIYLGGSFHYTVDFDPGPGTFNMSSSGQADLFILKLTPAGDFCWARRIGGTKSEGITSLLVDKDQNIYISGSLGDTLDVDPGPAVYNIYPTQNPIYGADVFLLKLNASATFKWAKVVGCRREDHGIFRSVDGAGNIYVQGGFRDSIDINPGPGVCKLIAAGTQGAIDIFILKLDSTGEFIWGKRLGNWLAEWPNCVADKDGNLFMVGSYVDTLDLDPGTGVYNVINPTKTNWYTFVLKLDSSGNFIWGKSLGSPAGMIFTNAPALDDYGNLLFTGVYRSTIDFDPGPGVYEFTGIAEGFQYVAKFSPQGEFIMAAGFTGADSSGGTSNFVFPHGDNVYLTGWFRGTVDFDAGPGNYNMTSARFNNHNTDNYIVKMGICDIPLSGIIKGSSPYCSLSAESFSVNHISGATTYDWSVPAGAVINSGQNSPSIKVTFGSSGGYVKLSVTNTCGDTYTDSVWVFLNQLPLVNYTASPSVRVCAGEPVTLSGKGAYSYTWSNQVIDGVPFIPAANGSYQVTGTDSNGCMATGMAEIIVDPLPVISISVTPSAIVCQGAAINLKGQGASAYSWSGSVSDGVDFIPAASDYFVITGTDSLGCKAFDSILITVNPLPLVGINVSPSANICWGDAVTLSGTGAFNYTWTAAVTNGAAFTPAQTDVYTVAATDTNGCADTADVTITVHALPTVSAFAIPSKTVCAGAAVTLTGAGASTYTWTNNVTNSAPFIATATNTYTVTGTDTNGCADTTNVTLTVNALPLVTASADPSASVCPGTTVTLTGAGALSYSWTDNVTDAVSFVPSATKNYTVTGTDSNGCTDTTSILVTVKQLPQFIMQPADQSVNPGSPALFSVVLNMAVQLKWQEDQGGGFSDLANGGQYSGVDDDSLRITNVSTSQHNFRYRCIATAAGCSETSTSATLTMSNVGIGIIQNESKFSVYPNPANDRITIKISNPGSASGYSITDNTGRIILSGHLSGTTTSINLDQLSAGFYFVHLDQAGTAPLKLVKQ